MFGITGGQVQPIGVDIGREQVKLLQTEVAGGSVVVRCAAAEPLPAEARDSGPAALAAAGHLIRQMLRQQGFYGRAAVAALPRHLVYVKNLRVPPMPAAELESAVRFEADHMFPFLSQEAVIQYLRAGEVRQAGDVRQELIVLAARRRDVDDYVELLHAAGLRVESLDAEPCALFRGFARFMRRREDEQAVQVICDVGYERSRVAIGRGRDISFYKSIAVGGRDFCESVSRRLGLAAGEAAALRRRLSGAGLKSEPGDRIQQAVRDAVRGRMEELARELSLCLRYHSVTFRGSRPDRVLLVGGEAHDRQLLETVQAAISIPVEGAWPPVGVGRRALPACGERLGPQWCVALGLSMKQARGSFAPSGAFDANDCPPRAHEGLGAQVIDLDMTISGQADRVRVADVSPEPSGPDAAPAREEQVEAANA